MPIRQAGKAQDSDSCIRAFEPLIGNYEEICGVEQLVACWAHNPKVAEFEPCPNKHFYWPGVVMTALGNYQVIKWKVTFLHDSLTIIFPT